MKLSSKVEVIKPSGIRAMFNKAMRYDDVVSFTLGEPDFTASDNVVREGCRAIAQGLTKYTANAGIMPLRKEAAARLAEYGLSYNAEDEVVITVGAMEALYLALLALLEPGDEVLIPTPCWTNYFQQVEMCGGRSVPVPCRQENGFCVDIGDLKAAITPRTRLLMLNSPCNPTGAVLDRKTIEEIAALCVGRDLIVLSDEVYKKILFEGEHVSIAAMSGMKNRTVVIDSFSKGYAMTGWRVGYAAGPAELVGAMTKFQENVAACTPAPSQYAALEALSGPQDHTTHMVQQYKKRRDYLVTRLNDMEGVHCHSPRGTFYAFVDIRELGVDAQVFADRLLEQKQVVVVPGTAFGEAGRGFIRISFATSLEMIERGMDRLDTFLQERGYR